MKITKNITIFATFFISVILTINSVSHDHCLSVNV